MKQSAVHCSTGWRGEQGCMLQGWGQIVQLAYPACFMKCIESWTFSGMLLVAGLLPQATIAVAAISVSFNCYGLLYILSPCRA